MKTETITWHPVADGLPDADITVLIALEGDSEPVWLGWYDQDCWLTIEGIVPAGRVTHWADLPGGPNA